MTANLTAAPGASGEATITFSFQMPSGETFTAQQNFWAGPPDASELDITNSYYYGQDILISGEPNVLVVQNHDDLSNAEIVDYDWEFSSGWAHWEQESNEMVSVVSVPYFSSGYETFFVRAENACGESEWHYETFEIVQNYYFSIYPNPASDYIELSIEPETSAANKTSKVKIEKVKTLNGLGEYTIEIWSEKGGKLKTMTSGTMNTRISTKNLLPGKYFVHLTVNGKTYKQQLIINK